MADADPFPLVAARPDARARPRPFPAESVDVDAMIRVDHAGEYGATRIYAGQLAVLGANSPAAHAVAHMASQEAVHHKHFADMLTARGIRPTLLHPLWNAAGFALGAATALIGPRAAMACTAAVETEIDLHYAEQLRDLGDAEPELAATIERFQAEELEHKETAIGHGAEQQLGYPLMSALIRAGCRAAIAVSKRI